MLRFAQNYTHNIMGYIFVTRNETCVASWLGVGCEGYIFVTREGVMLLEYGGDAA